MNKIQLLYVENVITRKKRDLHQELSFFMLVENLGHDKNCDVLWAARMACGTRYQQPGIVIWITIKSTGERK